MRLRRRFVVAFFLVGGSPWMRTATAAPKRPPPPETRAIVPTPPPGGSPRLAEEAVQQEGTAQEEADHHAHALTAAQGSFPHVHSPPCPSACVLALWRASSAPPVPPAALPCSGVSCVATGAFLGLPLGTGSRRGRRAVDHERQRP